MKARRASLAPISTGKLIPARQASKSARRADASASVSSAMRTRRDSADATSAAAKITDQQFLAIGSEIAVKGGGPLLGDQRRQEDAGVKIGAQSSFDSYMRSRISTEVNPTPGRAHVRARSQPRVPVAP